MADNKEKYFDLMNRAIDDDLSPGERSELEAYLELDPDARAEFNRLRMVDQAMNEIPHADPPRELKATIMERIGASHGKTASRFSVFDAIRDLFRHKIQWRYAYSFSAGVVLGIFILAIALQTPESSTTLNPNHVSGTISRSAAGEMPVTGEDEFEHGTLRGTLCVHEGRQAVLLTITIQSTQEFAVDILVDDSDLRPVTIWQPEPYLGAVSIEKNAVRLSSHGGTSFEIMFRNLTPGRSDVICRVSSGDLEHETEFTTGDRD